MDNIFNVQKHALKIFPVKLGVQMSAKFILYDLTAIALMHSPCRKPTCGCIMLITVT